MRRSINGIKDISTKLGKKCKQRCTVAIFIAADGSKVTGEIFFNYFERCGLQTDFRFTPNPQQID